MTSIIIDIPREYEERIVAAFCQDHGYKETFWNPVLVENTPNPQSKIEFMTKFLYEYVLQSIKIVETNNAIIIAKDTVSEDMESRVVPAMKVEMDEALDILKPIVEVKEDPTGVITEEVLP